MYMLVYVDNTNTNQHNDMDILEGAKGCPKEWERKGCPKDML